MKPFVKWAGGKRQILARINEFIKDSIEENDNNYTYIEPFLGGGAVFFDLKPSRAIINDLNSDLINAYKMIKSDRYTLLINELRIHDANYKADPDEYFYDIRNCDRVDNWENNYNEIQKASRMIFLNRTCYNGLYRVNGNGQFNTPIGRYANPTICDEDNIQEIHDYLSSENNKITIMNTTYQYVIRMAMDGDIIYLDPPYDYEDDDGFTKYQINGFTFNDFKNLKRLCDKAINRGAFVIISNNATSKVLNLFEQDPKYKIFYDVNEFTTYRNINCKGDNRKSGREAIFWGIPNNIPFPQANDMNKIIKLAMTGAEVLWNKSEAAKIIDVKTDRQVSYYLSALMFFKYITHDKKFTDRAEQYRHNIKALKKDIFEQLLQNDNFSEPYEDYKMYNTIDINSIKLNLKNNNIKLSESTITRRASTIKAWVEWMCSYSNIGKI